MINQYKTYACTDIVNTILKITTKKPFYSMFPPILIMEK